MVDNQLIMRSQVTLQSKGIMEKIWNIEYEL